MAKLGFTSSLNELDADSVEMFMVIEGELAAIRENEANRKNKAKK